MSSLPRIILVPGLGVIASGPDAKTARVNAEISARSHAVTARALDAFGAVDWLGEEEVFAFDYWPLELRKLQSAPSPRPLSGHVVLLAGADSSHALQVAERLADDGAHLVLIGEDSDALEQVQMALPSGVSIVSRGEPVTDAIRAFGGVDVLVALEPVGRATLANVTESIRRQGLDGVLVGVRSGDEATLPEPGSTTGIRRNDVAIAADADPSLVAEAIAFLASSRSGATCGVTIPVG